MGIFRKGKKNEKEERSVIFGYDYSDAERRAVTVTELFQKAKNAREPQRQIWERCNDYYNFIHDAAYEVKRACDDLGIPWVPAVMPDPYIMVESQIDPVVPEPEFKGRDNDLDSLKAKERENAVRYILERNRITDMNTAQERRSIKLGDAFFKCFWDNNMKMGISEGDIRIADIPLQCIYPDPAIKNGFLQDGQYFDYLYSIHKVSFAQRYRKDFEKRGLQIDELLGHNYDKAADDTFDLTTAIDSDTDTVQVLEHWFKWPMSETIEIYDGKTVEVKEGRVACSIQVGGKEIKLIPDYWANTGEQCKLFPFVHYWRIRDENQFWNKPELLSILDLVDAEDRMLANMLMNDAMMSNDIVMVEEGAIADGGSPSNVPGAVWMMKQNKLGAARRMGGLNTSPGRQASINWLNEQIQRTNRNYDTNNGKESSRAETATALSYQRADSIQQQSIKKHDRLSGFERLFELLDWSALEFYDDDRLIFIGAKSKNEAAVNFVYNSANYSEMLPAISDAFGNIVRSEQPYYPIIDVTANAGEGVAKGPQATLEVLDKLANINVTRDNYKILMAELEILQIPQKAEIIKDWQEKFENDIPTIGPTMDIQTSPQGNAPAQTGAKIGVI